MVLGSFGDLLLFQVTDETVLTLQNWKWSGSADYSTHKLHGHQALTEFIGHEPDQISFDVYFSWALGTDPLKMVWELWKVMRGGIALPLTIGNHPYGYYRWTIQDISNQIEYTDANGDLYQVKVTLKLLEYLNQVTV